MYGPGKKGAHGHDNFTPAIFTAFFNGFVNGFGRVNFRIGNSAKIGYVVRIT